MQTTADAISNLQQEYTNVTNRKRDLLRLDSFNSYNEISWKHLAVEMADLEKQLRELQESSDVLASLEKELGVLEKRMAEEELQLDTDKSQLIRTNEKKLLALSQKKECEYKIEEYTGSTDIFPELEKISINVLENKSISVESADRDEQKVREWLQSKIDGLDRKLKKLDESIVKSMHDFCKEYPAETAETDASIDAEGEYRSILEKLRLDDLPRFEKRFKELLNENTIREIANFQSQLNRERQNIKERIELINQSLSEIEYNTSRYIQLEAQNSTDPDIREFQYDIRECTEGSIAPSGGQQYAEEKFRKVKEIIEKFRGREHYSDADKRWTRKVTDVRNWFVFAASERWKEDDTEYEHYTDSGGKSGGQKEKLAYTVLAASLAYQFGLEWGEVRSRSFRFVVIDEAFGRGSDESARYALELFKKLDLQLFIITPLQKIHIIEPFVTKLGFVYNPEGRESLLREITIEEYRTEMEAASSAADTGVTHE